MQELMHIITEFPGWGVGKSRTYRSSGAANLVHAAPEKETLLHTR